MKKFTFTLMLFFVLFLAACASSVPSTGNGDSQDVSVATASAIAAEEFTPTLVLPSPTPTQAPPTATTPPTQTPLPTFTPTASLTLTITASPTITPTVTARPASVIFPGGGLLAYYVKVGTGGSVACGDSLFGMGTGVKRSKKIAADARAVLKLMLSNHQKTMGELYNPLYLARLGVLNVSFNPVDGRLEVLLSGTYKSTGDPCDNLRVRAMIWATLRQFSEVKIIEIYVGGIPLGDYLSNGR